MVRGNTLLHEAMRTELRAGRLPIMLGGDHSLGAGSVAASAQYARGHGQGIGVIWVDAHGDMNTPASSGSGNVHGMPLAALLTGDPAELAHFGGQTPAIQAEQTVLVGIRNLGPNTTSLLTTFEPVLTIVAGIAFLHETFTLARGIGALLLWLGLLTAGIILIIAVIACVTPL